MDLSSLIGDWSPEIRVTLQKTVQACLAKRAGQRQVDEASAKRDDGMARLRELGLSSLAVERELRKQLTELGMTPADQRSVGVSHDTVRRARRLPVS